MKQQDKTDKAEALGRAQEIAHIRHAAAVAHHRGGGVPLTGAPPPIPEASELEEEDPAKIRQRAREARAAEGVLLHSLGLQHEDADEEEGEELEEPGAPDEEGDGAEEEHAGAKKEEGQEAGGFAERKEDRKLGFRGRGGKTREWLSQGAVPEEVLAAQNTFLPRGEAGRALKPEKADGEGVKKKKKPAAGPGWSSGPVSQGRGLPAVRGRGKLTGGDGVRRPAADSWQPPDVEDPQPELDEEQDEEKEFKAPAVVKNPLCLW